MKEEMRKQKLVENITTNYRQVEQSIVNQLYMKQDLHGTSIGSAREDSWKQLFDMIIPKKFVIEHSVFIIDSEGNVSNEVDLAILDETYTPYIFRYGQLKFIPIEAVAVVVECKSKSLDKKGITNWYNKLIKLKTAENSIVRIADRIAVGSVPTQKSTCPIRILCALKPELDKEIKKKFDFVLVAVDGKTGHIEIEDNTGGNLQSWFRKLNFHNTKPYSEIRNEKLLKKIKLKDYEVKDEDGALVSLLTFNFQLNQLLMLINNPLLFPHRAYAELFNSERKDT
ncbi:hypothetical protein J27TS8_38680 [Robertmurraya siralis]|uniref:DUF6602 domain-containing protein n=1 Tax=Robertmurraya siralis TaxID=77777 RepID=A0A920BV17_9BACI|nr:DUF6602 domain-containing protein [Robertmurraya siralis]PAE20868.1 hypothetical protein CHH80_08985 [Bacillus sp. 7504-2]GIN63875.1 hypothetical protein J27TS8_38680 [Robertmurraya siralis]